VTPPNRPRRSPTGTATGPGAPLLQELLVQTDNPAVTLTSVTAAGSVTAVHARDLHKQPSGDAVTPRDAPPRCIDCGQRMTLIEPGQLAHPTCEPWPPSRMPSHAELVR